MFNLLLDRSDLDSPQGDLGPASLLLLFVTKLFKIDLSPEQATEGVRFLMTGGKVTKYIKTAIKNRLKKS